jgi:hypothetical protein
VTAAEGFGKTALFEILDGLEQRTRPQVRASMHVYALRAMLSWLASCASIHYANAWDVCTVVKQTQLQRAAAPLLMFESSVSVYCTCQ